MPIKNMPTQPGSLFVVATPIGNLSDISLRAIETIKEIDILLCEDTRRTSKLISHLGLSKRLERFDDYSGVKQIETLIAKMQEGLRIGLVTDAGTPAVSDPAASIVAACYDAKIPVVPIPGASAVTALLSVSGVRDTAFAFLGFFPRKTKERIELLKTISAVPGINTYIFFESPERIAEALETVFQNIPEAKLVVAKELTKIHEKIFTGGAEQVFSEVNDEVQREGAIGEWVFLVERQKNVTNVMENENSSDWVKALHCLRDAGVTVSVAAKQVSQHFGVSRNTVYEKTLIIFKKSE